MLIKYSILLKKRNKLVKNNSKINDNFIDFYVKK